jgi:hypothetical protein
MINQLCGRFFVYRIAQNKLDMNETLELQIKRLEFCRDCIVLDYDAGREEYNRLERMIEELKQLKSKQ